MSTIAIRWYARNENYRRTRMVFIADTGRQGIRWYVQKKIAFCNDNKIEIKFTSYLTQNQ